MAIAAGISVPRVYVLDKEEGINAFAAGYSPNEAVVAVTRGTLTQLTRDQLQGVIGHEFSHILHGDMGLNIRLLSWISGLLGLFVLGRFALRIAVEADDIRATVPLFALGLGLCALGFIGMLYGQVMQAAVSRQREYLADASAVQFTRNPEGIGGALRRIAGYRPQTQLHHPNGETLSYMCFGAAVRKAMSGLFATHPPIETRIAKIYGRRMPAILETPTEEGTAPSIPAEVRGFAPGKATQPAPASSPLAAAGWLAPEQVQAAHRFLAGLEPALTQAIHDPQGAQDVVAASLMLVEPAQRQRQLAFLKEELPSLRFATLEALIAAIGKLPEARRMELVELALPALTGLDDFQQRLFLRRMRRLALLDDFLCMQEFLLLKVVEYRLGCRFTAVQNMAGKPLRKLGDAVALLLSALAHASGERTADAYMSGIPHLQGNCRNLAPEPLSTLTLERMDQALEQLLPLQPLDKPLVLDAAVAIITYDGKTTSHELLLLRALCASLDVPLPITASLGGESESGQRRKS
jgi:hypothetical protein